jgi:hypothetical protein
MKGDFHVRFRENLRVKLPWVTRLAVIGPGQFGHLWATLN